MPSPPPFARVPLLLRSAAWRLGVVALLALLLLVLWYWALQGNAGA